MSEGEAASYAKRSGLQQDMGTKLMNNIMVTMEKGATVLDLGCGTGYLTKVLSERVGPEGKVVCGRRPWWRKTEHYKRKVLHQQHWIHPSWWQLRHFHQGSMISYPIMLWYTGSVIMKAITNMSTITFALARGRFAFTTLNSLLFPSLAVGIRLFVYNTLCTIAMNTQYELVRPNFLHQMFHEKMILLNSSEYRNIATTAGFQKISTTVKDWLAMHGAVWIPTIWFYVWLVPRRIRPQKIRQR